MGPWGLQYCAIRAADEREMAISPKPIVCSRVVRSGVISRVTISITAYNLIWGTS